MELDWLGSELGCITATLGAKGWKLHCCTAERRARRFIKSLFLGRNLHVCYCTVLHREPRAAMLV